MDRIITMKFRGQCRRCRNNIKVGVQVYWNKNLGIKCLEDCPERVGPKRKKKFRGAGNVKHRANQGARLLTGSNRKNR